MKMRLPGVNKISKRRGRTGREKKCINLYMRAVQKKALKPNQR